MVVVTPTAAADLDRLVRSLSLPPTTRQRVVASLRALELFPLIGAPLLGRWARYRFILGSWRWMLIVYVHDEATDRVAVVTIQNARSAASATSTG